MNLTDERLKGLEDASLMPGERASVRCQVAADLILVGQYEAARDAFGALWRGIGERPDIRGLDERAAADVLLQAGALSGWLGASRQVTGAQEKAKDLISESAALFEQLGEKAQAALARSELALCYWRAGAYDEARVLLTTAFEEVTATVTRAKVLLRLTTVEFWAGRYHDAFMLLKKHAHIFDERVPHALRGSFHSNLALVLNQLGTAEGRPDHLDRAIIEFTEAVYHYEQEKNERNCGLNLNNLAFLLYKIGRYRQAHEHLERVRAIFVRLGDAGNLAQVDETRARVFLAEGKHREANRVIAGVIQTLEKGGATAVLADALAVQGVIWSRLGVHGSSVLILRRAADIAEGAGASPIAGRAVLTLIEEHGMERLTRAEIYDAYTRANRLLQDTQNAEDVARLRACACVVLRRLYEAGLHDKGFTLQGAVHDFEARFIEQALREAGGSVTRAARLLGMRHQTLGETLKARHRDLLALKTPTPPRRKSIIRAPRKAPRPKRPAIRILLVEDDGLISGAVRDTLEDRGWAVSVCADGARALQEVEGDNPYALFLFDYDLPHVNGIELVRRARQFPHRRRTPAIMFSATDCEHEARLAGVDAFLRKPEDMTKVAETVARLLPRRVAKKSR
jgi:two-component system chemotaxis response regulator CheY